MVDYKSNENIFYKYIELCRKEILSLLFDNIEIINGAAIRNDLVSKKLIDKYVPTSEAIKLHRTQMVEVKLNHTKRIVDDVSKIAKKLGLNEDFEQILKLSALLHDIARFPQAVNSNSFLDRECKIFKGLSHAEFGYRMLYIDNLFNEFDIDKKFEYAIANAVRYHQIPTLTGDLAIKFNNVNELNVNKLTGNENLKFEEKIIVAALVQIVKDVDMLDILYQHTTGEFPVVKSYLPVKLLDNIDDICKRLNVSKNEILIFNNVTEKELYNLESINIPIDLIELSMLEVPCEIKNSFFNNQYMDLKYLQKRQDYTFIIGMWWRLNHFLNNINFVSNLEILDENKLLEQIYNMYPEEYRFLVHDAFEFANEQLLNKKITENKGKVYVKK